MERAFGQSPTIESPASESDRRLLVLLPVSPHRLVMEADLVREVVTVGEITTLPKSSDSLVGAIAVRGALLPLYDAALWCGGVDTTPRTARFATVVELEHASYAIQTTEHPTILLNSSAIEHRQAVAIESDVCIGVDPVLLLEQLSTPLKDKEASNDHD